MVLSSADVPLPSFTSKLHTTSYPSINPTKPSLTARGKNIFITGGGSGIGARTVQSFAEAGAAHIGILGRTEKRLLDTKQAINAKYPAVKVSVYVVDITKKDEVDRAFSAHFASTGKIDVLISSAGFGATDPFIKDADCENWMGSIDVNLKGSFLAAQAFLRSAAPDAVLVYISSVVSFGPIVSRYSSYAVSKAAAVRFFECVQIEHPEIRVVSIHPGIVDTEMTRKSGVPAMDDASLPADFMVWLASPEAAFLKGKYLFANWDVDEMKARAQEISGSGMLQMWVDGLPHKASKS